MLSTEDSYSENKHALHKKHAYAGKKKQSVLSQLVTAVGNFSVQYNFQAISIALLVMSASVCTSNDDSCKEGEQSAWVSSTATATVFVGAITGQLSMGYAGDVFGRNHAMTFTLSLVTIAAILSAAAPSGSSNSVYATIIVMRFILGIGAGGVYPLSATKASEDGGGGGDGIDLNAASWSFFWQVPGSMTPWILALIFSQCDMSADSRWRLLLGLGAIPSSFVVFCSLLETRTALNQGKADDITASHALLNPVHADNFEHHADGAIVSSNSMNSSLGGSGPLNAGLFSDKKEEEPQREQVKFKRYLRERSTWIKLLVTGGGWFIYDVAYYGVNLFGGQILNQISATDDDNVSANSSIAAVTQKQIIALSMGIPACLCAIATLRMVGTKRLQVYGFLLIAFCFILLAALFKPLSHGKYKNTDALFAVYCMLLFSLSYGPNLTTYILPAETYPKEVRATFNGISAACGKLGAVVGVYVFGPMAEGTSYATVMIFCASISVAGAVLTQTCITPKSKNSNTRALLDLEGIDGDGSQDDDNDSIVQ